MRLVPTSSLKKKMPLNNIGALITKHCSNNSLRPLKITTRKRPSKDSVKAPEVKKEKKSLPIDKQVALGRTNIVNFKFQFLKKISTARF